MSKLVKFSSNNYTNDIHFVVDDEDYDNISNYNWCIIRNKKNNYYRF